MTLRIGIDARTLLIERPTGVERVVHQFIDALRRVAPPELEFVLFVDEPPNGRLPLGIVDGDPGQIVVVPRRLSLLGRVADLWVAWQMRVAMKAHAVDAFWSPNTKFPLTPLPVFTTVHGLEWSFCSPEYRRIERLKQWLWFRLCTRSSRGLVTFAEHTAADIRRLRPACTIPTRVVPEGVSPIFRELAAEERSPEMLARLGVHAPFLLSVCSLEPRKNVDGLLRAFARLRREFGHQLVLVGRPGWKSEQLAQLAEQLGVSERVVFAGYVSDDELLQAYNQADVFVYPSKYEGFGLPLVEAMACGAPVVTSARSATGEVAGGAAELVDPDSVDDILRGLERVLGDEDLRARLAVQGRSRAASFTWDAMASQICGFLLETLGSPTADEQRPSGVRAREAVAERGEGAAR